MTITEWALVLAAAAFLLAPLTTLSFRPAEDQRVLGAAVSIFPAGGGSSRLVCPEGCSLR